MSIRLFIGTVLMFMVASFCSTAPLRAQTPEKPVEGEWPQWLGPNHDGKSTETGLLKEWPAGGLKPLWEGKLGAGYGTPVIAGGEIYATGDDLGKFYVYALDMDGQPKGKIAHGFAYTNDHAGARGSPTIDGGLLYILGPLGLLGCYDAKTLELKWKHEMLEYGGSPGHWGYAESPLIYGDLLIFKAGGKNCIIALDKKTGKGVWSSTGFAAGPEYGSCIPVSFGGVDMIVTGTKEGLIAVNAKTGALLWMDRFSAGNTANCPTPAYSDGYVFWANGYGKGGICMKLQPGGKATEAWTNRELVNHHGGYIIDNGYIYGNSEKECVCLDLKTGQKKWWDKAVGKGSIAWADGMLYLYSEKNGNAALATCSPDGFKITGKLQVGGTGPSWPHPVIAGGKLYLRYDTHLYCFDVKDPKAK